MTEERFILATEKIDEILTAAKHDEAFDDYFHAVAQYIKDVTGALNGIKGALDTSDISFLKKCNDTFYDELLPAHYEKSYLNPEYAVEKLGKEYGALMSAVYAECRAITAYAYEGCIDKILIRIELFLEIYSAFEISKESNEGLPKYGEVLGIYRSFAYDYLEDNMEDSVTSRFTVCDNVAEKIVREANLDTEDYLYMYGEYISDNELRLCKYMNTLDEETIESMARTYTQGYYIGFEMTGKDISIKEAVGVEYFIGFEKVVRKSIEMFEKIGLKAVIFRAEPSFVCGRKLNKRGYFSTNPCKQFDSDHEHDYTLYYDKKYIERKLEAYHNALERHKAECAYYGGPAVIECFGEQPFAPITKDSVIKTNDEVNKLSTEYMSRAGRMLNEYVKGEERSFTIIAFPTPAIGDKFEEIFDETIRINTLDYMKYRNIQQTIIDTLDKGECVRIVGGNGNLTDMTVALYELSDPQKETIFENCVADVNIPVGEVFTSPKLEGTYGLLHATHVYLEGMPYENLKLRFEDGMIKEYSCDNYDKEEENSRYIKEHLLFQHETLPLGEFAIGTNTTAYVTTRKYGLESIMPILIAEKTGPHFAVGDTCYSHEEDIMTYNPDKKAIVARENSISKLRHTDMLKAYFNCHTDITIPYDELKEVYVVTKEGENIDIISDGRFVLPGTEELNEPFDE